MHVRGCLKVLGWLKNFRRSANSTWIRSSPCHQVKAVGSWARDFAWNRLLRDLVPERLYEIDPLINRMIVKTWKRNENYLEYGMSSLGIQMALAVDKNSSQN